MRIAPITAAVTLLLLPPIYLGSYLALVVPGTHSVCIGGDPYYPYRYGGAWAERFFWPLEQLDRRIRPEPWRPVVGAVPDCGIQDSDFES